MVQQITNYDVYTSGMNKSYQDKLFFIDKIKDDINGIMDFGCANGSLLFHMGEILPEDTKLVGYDINENMLEMAKHKMQDDKYFFSSDYNKCLAKLNLNKSILNLSSVLHEVYSYSTPDEIEQFWKRTLYSSFKYIAIRDMCVSESINRPADINDITKLIQKANKSQLSEYESIWGSIRENRNMIHFLMKYRYLENWNREVRENYFPVSLERLLSKIPTDFFQIVYFENYTLPFTANKIKEDFDIDLHDNTHVKLLLKRKEII